MHAECGPIMGSGAEPPAGSRAEPLVRAKPAEAENFWQKWGGHVHHSSPRGDALLKGV